MNTQEMQQQLPKRPYCTNDLSAGLKIKSRAKALKCRYIQLNPPYTRRFITFDLDYECDGYECMFSKLPPAYFFVQNRENKHAHIIYVLDNPICTTDIAHLKPLQYLKAVIDAYTAKLKADASYSGLISKNPYSDFWIVLRETHARREGLFSMHLYTLNELAKYVSLPSLRKPLKRVSEEMSGLGRNCFIFEHVRVWAYRAIRQFWGKSYSQWFEAVEDKCKSHNMTFTEGLIDAEVSQIAKSISRWTWKHFTPEGFAAYQRGLVCVRWKNESRKVEGVRLLNLGLNVNEVAEALDVCTATVYNWRNELEPEGETLTEKEPWAALGISRATWYRRNNSGNP